MNPIVFVLVAAVLIGLAFYLVALPLLQQARRNAPGETVSSEQERLGELLAQRDAAFQALRELTFDHRVGKITDEDFAAFEAHLKLNAVESLRALDRWEGEADDELDAVMERAIRARKAELSGQPAAQLDGRVCSKCGKPSAAGDKFCGGCGSSLTGPAPGRSSAQAVQLACPKCGEPYKAGDKFCPKCGQALAVEAASAAR